MKLLKMCGLGGNTIGGIFERNYEAKIIEDDSFYINKKKGFVMKLTIKKEGK